MGGAQPLAATMNGACFLGIEVDPDAHQAPRRNRLLRRMAHDLDEAIAHPDDAQRTGEALSVGLVGNGADVIPNSCAAASCPICSPTRPARTIR